MRHALLGLGLVFVWCLPHPAGAQSLDQVRQGVVKVVPKVAGRGEATGFVVRTEAKAAYIVTASHVVAGAAEIGVEFFGTPRLYPGRVLGMEGGNEPHGLAALIVEGDVPASVVVLAFNRDLDVQPGEPITVIGFPQKIAIPWAVTRGSTVGRKGKAIWFSGAAVDVGNSGGPLLKGDHVIGVITNEQGSYAFATPSLIVQYALESWGVRFGVRLRSTPFVLQESELSRMIQANGFNHPARWVEPFSPPSKTEMVIGGVFGHFRHEYDPRTLEGVKVVVDHATRLMWQRSPSATVLDRGGDAKSSIETLNKRRDAGFSDWRVPTIEELASLIEARGSQAGPESRFIDPLFDFPWVCVSADAVLMHDAPHELGVSFRHGSLVAKPPSLGWGFFTQGSSRPAARCVVRSLGHGELRSVVPGAK